MTSGQPEGRFPPGRPRVQGERLGGRPGVLAPRSRRGPVLLGGGQRLLPPVTAALPAASAGLAEAAASMCAPPAGARPWPWRLPPGRRACASAAWAVLPSPEARCTRPLRLPHRRAHPPGRHPHGLTYLLPPVQREHALATPPSSALGPSALFTLVSSGASSVVTTFPASVSASPSGPAPRPPSRCQPARVSAEATLSPPSPSPEPPLSAGGTVVLRRACSLRAPHHPPACHPAVRSQCWPGPDVHAMPRPSELHLHLAWSSRLRGPP